MKKITDWLYPPVDWLNPGEDKETDPLADTTASCYTLQSSQAFAVLDWQ